MVIATIFATSCAAGTPAPTGKRFDHVVVVFEENKSASQVRDLPYLATLRSEGVEFTQSYALYRPSQPNYIAFFSGLSGNAIYLDNNADDYSAPNLYTRLAEKGLGLFSYSQSLPSAGFRGATGGRYVRKHNPVASFTNVLDAINRPFGDFPVDAAGYSALPAVSFVIPDLDNDMHDGTPGAADSWLRDNLGAYAEWARSHRSLLIVTFDEPDGSVADISSATILTLFVGAGLKAGSAVSQRVTHYTMLRFLLDEFGCPSLGLDAAEAGITLP